MQDIKSATLERIEDDRLEAPEDVGRILDAIARHLFEPAFGGEALRRGYLPAPETLWNFWQRLGCDPATYMEQRRLETACRAVRETEARVAEMADSLGFEQPSYFSKWLKKRTGLGPNQLRALAARQGPARQPEPKAECAEPKAMGKDQIVLSPALARKALVGMLGAEDLQPLLGYLRGLYPEDANEP